MARKGEGFRSRLPSNGLSATQPVTGEVSPRANERDAINGGIERMFHLDRLTDYALLLLRLMAGLIYADSGLKDLRDPSARSKSIGMSKNFTIFLAAAELAGGVGIILGVLQQLAAIGLILIMFGAIQKKIVVWKTGFWGEDGLGWSYDLTFVSMLFVILSTDGGRFVLLR